jgi:hypothetical protein
VPSEKASETHVMLEVEMELRGLSQGFEVLGRIRQKDFDEKRLEAKVKAALVSGLPKRIVVDFFKLTEIMVSPDDPELDVDEATSTVDDIHAPHLEEQAKAGNGAAKEWNAAIADVCEGLRGGYEFNHSKVQDGFMFIEWCHRAANNGTMQMWCEEKLGRIRSDMARLAKYKSSRHPNAVRTTEDIQGLLCSWPVVNSWHHPPPRRPGGA